MVMVRVVSAACVWGLLLVASLAPIGCRGVPTGTQFEVAGSVDSAVSVSPDGSGYLIVASTYLLNGCSIEKLRLVTVEPTTEVVDELGTVLTSRDALTVLERLPAYLTSPDTAGQPVLVSAVLRKEALVAQRIEPGWRKGELPVLSEWPSKLGPGPGEFLGAVVGATARSSPGEHPVLPTREYGIYTFVTPGFEEDGVECWYHFEAWVRTGTAFLTVEGRTIDVAADEEEFMTAADDMLVHLTASCDDGRWLVQSVELEGPVDWEGMPGYRLSEVQR